MEQEKNSTNTEAEVFQPGEKGFAAFLLAVGLFFTWQSWLLYRASPSASSYGAVPLACSLLIDVFAVAILISDRNKTAETSKLALGAKIKCVVHYLVPQDVLVVLALVVLYCAALYLKIGFIPATSVFLWVGMSYLMRGKYLFNLIWTFLCVAFIYVVFHLLFSVVLP